MVKHAQTGSQCSVSNSISHDSNMVVMENNVVHEGSMEMNGIPEGWTDLGNGLYSDENGDQVTEWVFDFMIRIIITTWDDYHLKFLDSKKRLFNLSISS